jgi:hypothetical protein
MSFSDDDLKRWKEKSAIGDKTMFHEMTVDHEIVRALLARLEAAEAVCRILFAKPFPLTSHQFVVLNEAFQAWRNAAGKPDGGSGSVEVTETKNE